MGDIMGDLTLSQLLEADSKRLLNLAKDLRKDTPDYQVVGSALASVSANISQAQSIIINRLGEEIDELLDDIKSWRGG